MDQLRRVMETIRSAYESLRPTHKMLAMSLATVLAMTLFLVQQYTARPDMVPLLPTSYAPEDQGEAAEYLSDAGITFREAPDGSILVHAGERRRIISEMGQQGRLPGDTSLMFRNLIAQQTWTMTTSDKDRAYQLALQNELAMALRGWSSIRDANVYLNLPKTRSIGRPSSEPSASVSIEQAGDFGQRDADSIARFVAGASRGLRVERVSVTDANGRSYSVRSDEDLAAADTQELIAQIERQKAEKIYNLLGSYIPGVIVEVTAAVDATRVQTARESALDEGDGTVSVLAQQTRSSNESSGPASGGAPGARANTGANIQTGTIAGASTSESDSEAQFMSVIGKETKSIIDPRGFATKINAVIDIPRAYFASLWRAEETRVAQADDTLDPPAPDADPTDAQIAPFRDAEIQRISGQVARLIDTSANDGAQVGEVTVSMMPIDPVSFVGSETQAAGFLGIGGGGSGGGGVGDVVRTLGLGGLAVLALGLMVFTALKANKTEDLPTAEELVGIPPALDSDSEIIGEADGADPPLEGIEISDDEMHKRRMKDQVSEVVRERPEDAARIIQQWMSEDQ